MNAKVSQQTFSLQNTAKQRCSECEEISSIYRYGNNEKSKSLELDALKANHHNLDFLPYLTPFPTSLTVKPSQYMFGIDEGGRTIAALTKSA